MYVDGNLETTYDYTGDHLFGAGYHIGASDDTGAAAEGFDGMMDDFAIWDNALTQIEVESICQYGIGTQIPEPASIFLFMILAAFVYLKK